MRALSLALAAWLATTDAAAQPSPLALSQVLDAVDRAHPTLDAAARDQGVADAELLAAEGAFDPLWRTRAGVSPLGYYQPITVDSAVTLPTTAHGLSLFAGYRLGRSSYTGFPTYDSRETNAFGELRAGVSLPLLRNGPVDRSRANIARAEAGRSLARASLAQQRFELRRAGAVRYWEWVAAGQRLAIARDLLRLATERDAAVATRAARGDIAGYERADNQRAVAQREGLVAAAERALEQSAIELSLFLRDEGGHAVTPTASRLPGAVPAPTEMAAACVARSRAGALTRRPEVSRLQSLRAQQDVERRWAADQRRPALDLQVSASQDLGDGPESRRDPAVDVALTLEVPLRNRVATGRERAAQESMARAEAQLRLASDRVDADVRDALSALDAARRRAEAARREHALARELELAERQRFAAGDSSLLFVNLREQATAEAALRVVDAHAEFQRGLAAWHFATATDPRVAAEDCAR